jgi:uncharacterized membrane protein (UPF0127 family)
MVDPERFESERAARWMLRVALAVLGAGLLAFVVQGANRPADPYIDDPAASDDGRAPRAPGGVPVGFDTVRVRVADASGAEHVWCLLAAFTAEQRRRGLMEVEDLGDHPGMAFVYDEDVQNPFHMQDTPMPLSIAWVSVEGRVVDTADMDPCLDRDECPHYLSGAPYRYAIEVPAGGLPGLGITPDATVRVGGRCPAPR